jgi:hypothetical protein
LSINPSLAHKGRPELVGRDCKFLIADFPFFAKFRHRTV